jgi:hypothetical protein
VGEVNTTFVTWACTCRPRWSLLNARSTRVMRPPFSSTACFSFRGVAGSKNFCQFCLISRWAAAGSSGPVGGVPVDFCAEEAGGVLLVPPP